ncbi:4'-phosphopantetheinyl transferase family protein [Chryseobacterium sp. JV274]|jgi:4'-phosphopantetheinyl transferase|uniref:4'-phosphopantetheinyl transferase family protein n=1 Tax=unclassified Chryseobacterium TaxID=2593645 RepID=UPI0015C26C1B|nr:4'-phosphopantetheinyl transferase superfamily protein [Chryseobacterium sp. JV274]CAD0222591.1 4-phosphopantetheinyl transferase [Chryseobacterium sp. JV274]
MIILYTFISEEKHQSLLDRYLPVFSDDMKRDILRYRRWQDAQLSLLGKLLLRHGLRTFYNIPEVEIGILPNKKPYLKGHNLHFNISHSKDLVACVIAEYPLGIDVEYNDPKVSYRDFIFQMTPNEMQEIQDGMDKMKGFFTYWTRKEAAIKAHGGGMILPLDSFEVTNGECVIEDEKFFIKEIFIHKDYHSYMASSDPKIKNVVPLFKHFEGDIL